MQPSLQPKKSLGQNFLTDPAVIESIVGALTVPSGTQVVEIGPGAGAMTGLLHRKFPRFQAVEIDERAVGLLGAQIPGLKIHHGDVLDTRWLDLLPEGEKVAVIGNLPYYISSPILFLMIDNRERFSEAVIMVQKEVAERIVAKPGTKAYGILSVQTQLAARAELLFTVPRQVFHPVPNVDSAVVRLFFDLPVPDVDAQWLRKVIRQAFGQRRKMLRNTLAPLLQGRELPGWDFTRRAETLSKEEFVALARELGP